MASTSPVDSTAPSPPSAGPNAQTISLLGLPQEMQLEILKHLFTGFRIVLFLSPRPGSPLQFNPSSDRTKRTTRDYDSLQRALPTSRDMINEAFFSSIAVAFRSIERHGGGTYGGRTLTDVPAHITSAIERYCRDVIIEQEVGDPWYLSTVYSAAIVDVATNSVSRYPYTQWVRDSPDGYNFMPMVFGVAIKLGSSKEKLNAVKITRAGVRLYNPETQKKKLVRATKEKKKQVQDVLQAVVEKDRHFTLSEARAILGLVEGWEWKVEKGKEPRLD